MGIRGLPKRVCGCLGLIRVGRLAVGSTITWRYAGARSHTTSSVRCLAAVRYGLHVLMMSIQLGICGQGVYEDAE